LGKPPEGKIRGGFIYIFKPTGEDQHFLEWWGGTRAGVRTTTSRLHWTGVHMGEGGVKHLLPIVPDPNLGGGLILHILKEKGGEMLIKHELEVIRIYGVKKN